MIKALKGLVDYFSDNPALKKQREDARRRLSTLPQLIERQLDCSRKTEAAKLEVNRGEKTPLYLLRFEHEYTAASNAVTATRTLENYLVDSSPESLRVERQRAKKRVVACTSAISKLRFDLGQAEEKIKSLETEKAENAANYHDDYEFQSYIDKKIRDARRTADDFQHDLNEHLETYPELEQALDEAHKACLEA